MKLLYIADDRFPPFRADVVELFAREMSQLGHEVEWMMRRGPEAGAYPSVTTWEGNRVYLSSRSHRAGRWGRLLSLPLEIWGDFLVLPRVLRGGYDAVLVRDRFVVALWAWLSARLSRCSFVYWMSYPFAESKIDQARRGFVPHPRLTWLKGQAIRLLLYKAVLPLADHVFVQSDRMKQDVACEGVSPEKMTPVPMGIRSASVGVSADARAPDTQAPLLLYLGIILRLRQTEMLVRVLALVRRHYPHARLRYVGGGQHDSDALAVVDEARRLGLAESVEITGFLPMNEAWRHVRDADICFSPFYPIPVLLSTSPTKLVEYMAMAKCVVANDHPEQSKVLGESGAGRTVPWDEQAFADEVCRLLDDPEQARRMASRGPDYVRRFRTYDVIARDVESSLLRVTGKRQSS